MYAKHLKDVVLKELTQEYDEDEQHLRRRRRSIFAPHFCKLIKRCGDALLPSPIVKPFQTKIPLVILQRPEPSGRKSSFKRSFVEFVSRFQISDSDCASRLNVRVRRSVTR